MISSSSSKPAQSTNCFPIRLHTVDHKIDIFLCNKDHSPLHCRFRWQFHNPHRPIACRAVHPELTNPQDTVEWKLKNFSIVEICPRLMNNIFKIILNMEMKHFKNSFIASNHNKFCTKFILLH